VPSSRSLRWPEKRCELTVLVVAFVLAAAGTGLTIPLLRRARVVDVPNARSSHADVVPRGGGVAVLVGIAGAVAVATPRPAAEALVLVGSALFAGLLGLVDDVRSLPVPVRLAVQAVLALAVAGWVTAQHVSRPGIVAVGAVAGAVWLVGYVNAFNFMDGINGISGLSAVVAGGWYAWLGQDHHEPVVTVLGLALAGAAAGFLPWNVPRARVFLGDVGSYGIGMVIACTSLVAVLDGIPLWMAAAPLAIYLTDTAWALAKRLVRGDSWRDAHREHVYQRLVDTGWSHTAGAVLVATAALVLAVTSAALPIGWFVMCALGVVGGYLGLPALMGRQGEASR
jgi:UDP-GlcNAc:undecaprenyl-phosphate/decaprenyl-phosphate GlcNAc-1-phosphate transferase